MALLLKYAAALSNKEVISAEKSRLKDRIIAEDPVLLQAVNELVHDNNVRRFVHTLLKSIGALGLSEDIFSFRVRGVSVCC